jgi:hypothetical protein
MSTPSASSSSASSSSSAPAIRRSSVGGIHLSRISRSRGLDVNSPETDRPVTLQDLQDLSRSLEFIIQTKNELILTKIHELEMKMTESRRCSCGLTQSQLDFYRWVDPTTGRCTARYVDSDGRELICSQLYTSHDQTVGNEFLTMAAQSPSSESHAKSTTSAGAVPIAAPPPPPPTPTVNAPEPSVAAVTVATPVPRSEAVARIQRLASRRRAWKTAEAEREWKVSSSFSSSSSSSSSSLSPLSPTVALPSDILRSSAILTHKTRPIC